MINYNQIGVFQCILGNKYSWLRFCQIANNYNYERQLVDQELNWLVSCPRYASFHHPHWINWTSTLSNIMTPLQCETCLGRSPIKLHILLFELVPNGFVEDKGFRHIALKCSSSFLHFMDWLQTKKIDVLVSKDISFFYKLVVYCF